MSHSDVSSFCEYFGCTRQALPYSKYCQFCQKKGAKRDYVRQSIEHVSAIRLRRVKTEEEIEPWKLLLAQCQPCNNQRYDTNTYAIGVHRYVKFGQSRNLQGRLMNLQIGNPHRLRVLASVRCSFEMEHHIHSALKTHVYRGDWFHLNSVTRQFIELMRLQDLKGICQQITHLIQTSLVGEGSE